MYNMAKNIPETSFLRYFGDNIVYKLFNHAESMQIADRPSLVYL
jgi:hypothetical protein